MTVIANFLHKNVTNCHSEMRQPFFFVYVHEKRENLDFFNEFITLQGDVINFFHCAKQHCPEMHCAGLSDIKQVKYPVACVILCYFRFIH